MDTSCPSCKYFYSINDNQFGQLVICPKCKNEHTAMFATQEKHKPDISQDLQDPELSETNTNTESIKKRRSAQAIMQEKIVEIGAEIERFIPLLMDAETTHQNESNTRMILDKILMDALGYKINEIKTEQKIQGKRADYVLSVNDEDLLVIELKRVGMVLRDKQVFQAVSYGAYSGIKWAILTNGLVWHLYRVSLCDKVDYDHVFTLDLRDGLDDMERHYFYLLSRHGITRKGLLDKVWNKLNTLSHDGLMNAVLTDDVISKIRIVLNREYSGKLTQDEVRAAVESSLLHLD